MRFNRPIHQTRVVLTAVMSLALINCSDPGMTYASAAADESTGGKMAPARPPVPKFGSVSLSYRRWGGFPGPSGPRFTNLNLQVQLDGKVTAKLETATCLSKMNITKAEFEELVARVNNSAYFIGVGFAGADIGTRI